MSDKNDLKEKVIQVILSAINYEDLSPCDDLFMLDVDSIDSMSADMAEKIVALIEKETAPASQVDGQEVGS